ncbi:hypothetical protein SOCEGT47_017750 [Sorangium cellulosum]|uniref:Uncharacterized protein n=1 Tax=Sorangium cellulosum TaxID=56 RepID=A0A4P2PWW7_SORCE|nr:hypothetical protein SOCEGT47_017750 [Sorangium cellulosum]
MDPANAPVSRWRSALLRGVPGAALLLAACGPAPTLGEPHAAALPPAQTVYIVLGEPPPAAEPSDDAWVPDEDHGENPFERTRTWIGDYDCPQGTTEMTFRILQVRGSRIKAVFGFHHAESGVSGKYLMRGRYDAQARTATFSPGAWLERPPNYVTVSMKGDLALDGSLFAGRIEHPECGAFRLRPAS